MEELAKIRAERYKLHLQKKSEELSNLREKQVEIKFQKFQHKCKSNIFSKWRFIHFNPWIKEVKIIIRFLRWVRFWNKSPISYEISPIPIETDEEINRSIQKEYNESLMRDRARESINITYWANKYIPNLSPSYMIHSYINRHISVNEFIDSFSHWKQHKTLLFWIKVHLHSITAKVPIWVGINRDSILDLSRNTIILLVEQMKLYEKHQCPHCDNMVELSDLVNFNDYMICISCNFLSRQNSNDFMSDCFICSNLKIVRLYENVPVCEDCARRQNIYEDNPEEKAQCPGCNQYFKISEMLIHEEGMHFCKECGPMIGLNIEEPQVEVIDNPIEDWDQSSDSE